MVGNFQSTTDRIDGPARQRPRRHGDRERSNSASETRRAEAASRFRPAHVKLLLVAETPPTTLDRYFYFEDVPRADYLFRAVVPPLLGEEPSREKTRQLAGLRDRGVFLIDLRPDPLDTQTDEQCVPDLIRRVRAVDPESVLLIKVNVYDVAYRPLHQAGVPVVDARLPSRALAGSARSHCYSGVHSPTAGSELPMPAARAVGQASRHPAPGSCCDTPLGHCRT